MDKNIIYILLGIILFSYFLRNNENFNINQNIYNKPNSAICFITRSANKIILDFAEECTKYNDVYIVIDDNDQKVTTDKVHVIQINEDECKNKNYIRSTWRFNMNVSGWDKAFYYFCENNKYDNVWFIEDDVFIPSAKTLYNIDIKYGKADFLSNLMTNVSFNGNEKNKDWLKKVTNAQQYMLSSNIYWSWVCAMRCSDKLLKLIKQFKNAKGELFFHEMMIPSLVAKYNYTYKTIPELKNIYYRRKHEESDILKNPTWLYHPIKDYDQQYLLRKKLNKV